MIMTIDVGNTNITVGVFRGDEVVSNFRITTKMPRTSDEYGMLLSNLLEQNSISHDDIEDAIIASVVPNVMHSLEGAIIKYFSIRPIIVEPGTKTGIRVVTENPRQIGADRIVDAAAAYELYGGPVLVLDFGTATTYDLVDKDGAFVSGVTAPGIRISAKALWEDAAKLPEIEIRKPASILAKETISSMQAGLVYGQIGQTEYIIRHMIDEANMGEVKVVATGGLGRIIANETTMIDVYDPNLTLKGMNLIYKKNGLLLIHAQRLFRFLYHFFHIFLACYGGIDLGKVCASSIGDDFSQGGLSGSWRTVKNNGSQLICLDGSVK